MKDCWSEGNLRAYHDGELPPEAREHVAAHLPVCAPCQALSDEVAGRAARVSSLMAALPEPNQVMWMPRRPVAPRRVAGWPVWAGAAAALAAGIAMAMWAAPGSEDARTLPLVSRVGPSTPVAVPEAIPVLEP